jgi:hypothetical protein
VWMVSGPMCRSTGCIFVNPLPVHVKRELGNRAEFLYTAARITP